MTRPVALKSSDITMVNRVALRLCPVDMEPKARRMVKVARIFSTVGGMEQGVTYGPGATISTSHSLPHHLPHWSLPGGQMPSWP